VGIAMLSIAAAARQAPLHAITTEIVASETRGEYIALRNASSQVGIAAVATISASAFDRAGFSAVALIAAIATLLIPICCIWLREPKYKACYPHRMPAKLMQHYMEAEKRCEKDAS